VKYIPSKCDKKSVNKISARLRLLVLWGRKKIVIAKLFY